ncbi:membrane protein ORF25 [Cyprinid herpesvirus 1]|uniref:Membrane protein ORF25 n=1 Tax=Cyprinid herpesvirus 1 TaxID=317858 RepID=K7PBK6_9VIRU|nr:membrane protein ORF25 [Cyprinid herpesvirus 1]AFJ20326.1 membrane protein ORF25 [Cyprinid herpesvirus 1]
MLLPVALCLILFARGSDMLSAVGYIKFYTNYCAVNNLPFSVYAEFAYTTVDRTQWMVPDTDITQTSAASRVSISVPENITTAANNTAIWRSTLTFNPFTFIDSTVSYTLRIVGTVNSFPQGVRYGAPPDTVQAASLQVHTAGIDHMTGGTLLKCTPSCVINPALNYVWYLGNEKIEGASTDTLITSESGLYMCSVEGSQLFSGLVWSGVPIFDCPFKPLEWCSGGVVNRHSDGRIMNYTEEDTRQPGSIFVCNDTKAVSTRGTCENTMKCTLGVSSHCATNVPIVYSPCNTTVHKWCPEQLTFTWSASYLGNVRQIAPNRLLFSGGIVTTFCGAQTEIYVSCGSPEEIAMLAAPKTSYEVPQLDSSVQINPTKDPKEVWVQQLGSMFEMDCTSSELVVYWLRNGKVVSVSLGGGGATRIYRTAVTKEDLNSTWACVSINWYTSKTANTIKSLYLTDTAPTTPAPPTTPTTAAPSTTPTTTTTTESTTTVSITIPPIVISSSSSSQGITSAAGDPVNITSAGTPAEVTSSGAPVQVTSSGAPVQVTSSGAPVEVTSSGAPVEVTSSGAPVEVTSSGAPVEVTSSGAPVEVTSSGTPVEVTSSGIPAEVTSSGTPVEFSSSGSPHYVTSPEVTPSTTTKAMVTTTSIQKTNSRMILIIAIISAVVEAALISGLVAVCIVHKRHLMQKQMQAAIKPSK